jgi:hypothetical protein
LSSSRLAWTTESTEARGADILAPAHRSSPEECVATRMPHRYPFGAALLALAIGIAGFPAAGWADDDNDNSESNQKDDKSGPSRQTIVPAGARPDLKVEYAGFSPPNLQHTVTFKVTNIGLASSSAIKAQIQTLGGGPPNPASPDVPSLAPGQSHVVFYGIGTCNGHVVQATVNDPMDFPSVNDRAEAQACPATNAPSDKVVNPTNDPLARAGAGGADAYEVAKEIAEEAAREAARIAALPEHMRPGSHNVVLEPNYVWSAYRDHFFESGGCGPYSFGSSHGRDAVGWLQAEQNRDILGFDDRVCAYIGVAQMVVGFPFALFDEIPVKHVTRAILSFEEHEGIWRDNGGRNHCVTTVRFGPRPYLSGPDGQIIFAVTEAVGELVSKANDSQRVGWAFTLMGQFEPNDLEAEGSSSCMSLIRDPRLQVYFDVP